MRDVVTIGVVTLRPAWGDTARNLSRIRGFLESAARRGADLVVLPEMALTGYDDVADTPRAQKMQVRLAETIPGPSTRVVAELTRSLGIHAFVGMPERDPDDPARVYNSAAVFSPDGLVGAYRKIHLPPPEPAWATRGDTPCLVDTPWGPVGVAICYDTYRFPELLRYYVAQGARLIVNCTANGRVHGPAIARTSVEWAVIANGIFVASANLGGQDLTTWFWGGSSVVGPSARTGEACYYSGQPFATEGAEEEGLVLATVDLSLATRRLVQDNPAVGGPDFRPDLYATWYAELAAGADRPDEASASRDVSTGWAGTERRPPAEAASSTTTATSRADAD